MTSLTSVSRLAFDQQARAEVRGLIRSNQGRVALERLDLYEAKDREQQVQIHLARAVAYHDVGDFDDAIRHWFRALHRTSRYRPLRHRIRIGLAETLTRIGDLARAERILQRSVAEIRAQDDPSTYEVWALGSLARIHFRRGSLNLAIRLFEIAMGLTGDGAGDPAGDDPQHHAWVAQRLNSSFAFMRLGDFARADGILSEVEASKGGLDPYHLAPLLLTRALFALETDDLAGCESTLRRIDDTVVGDNLRYRLAFLQYEGALRIAQGDPARALEGVEQALRALETQPHMDDMIAELSRLKAEALLALGRPQHALAMASEAVRACRGSDMLDQPAGLRVTAKCLAALGRHQEAREAFASAVALLETTEFVVERRRLYRDIEALGMTPPGARAAPWSRHRDGAAAPAHRFALKDGRGFVTSEGDLVDRIRTAAENRLPVLLEGETGTGKELVARLLHELGNAREGPFVVVDCTTLSETLAEAELFGVARGAYTGAAADRQGLVAAADGGTLLFDELPELSLPAQSKLLRLLQEGTYRRLGEARPRNVSVRVIASTNQDSERLLAAGTLKPDLFFRLHGYRIRLRPLRDRPQDIALLAEEFARSEGMRGVTAEALAELRLCSWPGNARQLEMLIRVAASGLGVDGWLDRARVAKLLEETPSIAAPSGERQRLQQALDAHAGNVAATARALGMSRQGLYKALHRNHLI